MASIPEPIRPECVGYDSHVPGIMGVKDRARLSIALCSFNGEAFLPAQLESFVQQTRLPDELIVQDDGSVDRTRSIVQEFSERAMFAVRLQTNMTPVGVVRNFARAVQRCDGDYIALADQDDVWHPRKLEILAERLERMNGRRIPALVHCDMRVTDAADRVISSSFFVRRGFAKAHPDPLRELLPQNYATGCAMMFSRAVADLALPIPAEASIHDWWFVLIAAAAGQVATVPEQLVDYRAHGANAVGAKNVEWKPYLKWRSARKFFGRALIQAEALLRRLDERGIKGERVEFVRRWVSETRKGGGGAAAWIAMNRVRLQHPVPTFLLCLHVLRRSLADAVAEGRKFDKGLS